MLSSTACNLRQSTTNRDNELAVVSRSYFGCTCTLAGAGGGAPDGGARPHRFLASGRPRQERRVTFAKTHRSSRKLGGINHATARCISAVAEVTKRDHRVFWRNWRTLRERARLLSHTAFCNYTRCFW